MTILLQNCSHLGKTSRNLNKKIHKHKKDFKTGNTTNSLVSHNISTNHTFDFQKSNIFAFIHDRDKRRIIEAFSILYFDTLLQRQSFYKMSSSLTEIIIKDFKIYL